MPINRKKIKHFIQTHHRWITLGAVVLLGAGLYLLSLTLAPTSKPKTLASLPPVLQGQEVDPQGKSQPIAKNQIIIPKIGVVSRIFTGEAWALNLGVWHRYPERGDPVSGGNFILSAHRFHLDWTPEKTRTLSPFYHIDKLTKGDEVFIDYKGTRYRYVITKTYPVKPTQVEIEAPSETAHLTLYSCTLKGEADGRNVIEAILQKS